MRSLRRERASHHYASRQPLGRYACLLALIMLIGLTGAYHRELGLLTWKRLHLAILATALDPSDATLVRDIGVYNFSSKRYDLDTAERYFDRALAINSRVPYAHFELGRIAFIRGDLTTALVEADTEHEVDPSLAQVYYLRGLTFAYAGSLDAAVADFTTYLTLEPKSWPGHNDLAWVYFRKGEFTESATYAQEGLASAPGNPWLENTLGIALLNLHEYARAREELLAAEKGFDAMRPAMWGSAYPGNDPRVYAEGLEASRKSVEDNLALLVQKTGGR